MRKVLEFHVTLNKLPIVTNIVLRVKISLGSLESTKFNIAHVPLSHYTQHSSTFLRFQ
jgi:hypothetical protein